MITNIKTHTLCNWVEQLQIEGKITFSLVDAIQEFPLLKLASIRNSLNRLVVKNKIASVWNGFYVIVPLQYFAMQTLPAVMYVDYLMKHLNRKYYVSLLNAASFYGASHQSPQEFTIMTSMPPLRDNKKKGIKLNFICRKHFNEKLIQSFNTEMGSIQVSSPELTAMDLIQYNTNIGGLNRAATILNELAEVMNFNNIDETFFDRVPTPTIQRLGYILEYELGHQALAECLRIRALKLSIPFRTTLLKVGKGAIASPINERWKIIINENIEIDE